MACKFIHHLPGAECKHSKRIWKVWCLTRQPGIYGRTGAEQQQVALQQIRTKICAIYNDPPRLAPQFPSISEVPLEHCLKMSLQTAEQWLSLIQHQVKVTSHNLQCLLRQHNTMPTHFRTMRRREARGAQAKERALPETPTKQHSREVQRRVQEMRAKLYAPKQTLVKGPLSHRKNKGKAPQIRGSISRSRNLRVSVSPIMTAHPQPRRHPP